MLNYNAKCPSVVSWTLSQRVCFVRKTYITAEGRDLLNRQVDDLIATGSFRWHLPLESPEYYTYTVCTGALRKKNERELPMSYIADGIPSSRDLRIQCFVKDEGINITKFNTAYADVCWGGTDAAATAEIPPGRAIMAATRPFNLALRRFIGPIEAKFYSTPRVGSNITTPHPPDSGRVFAKGLDSRATADLLIESWGLFEEPCAMMFDASRADAHIREEHHSAKFRLYEEMLGAEASAYMARLKKHYLKPKLSRVGGIAFKVGCFLFSGVMDTALANNMVFWLCHSLFRRALLGDPAVHPVVASVLPGFPILELGEYDLLFILNGDDCVPFMERWVADKIVDWVRPFYGMLGINMRIDGVARMVEEIDFCQSRPVQFRPGEWKMVRTPRKVLQTILSSSRWSGLSPHARAYRLGTLGVCEMILNLGIPVLEAFACALHRNALRISPTGDFKFDHELSSGSLYRARVEMRRFGMRTVPRMMTPSHGISGSARVSFSNAFGISPDEQVAWETYFNTWEIDVTGPSASLEWDVVAGTWA